MAADRSKKKERKRLKRAKKQRAVRKAAHASPYQQIARGSELIACNVNSDWRERGQASVFILRRSGGQLALASFFVDLWCCGLKDAWGRFGVTREEYDQMLARMGVRMDNVPLPAVARSVA